MPELPEVETVRRGLSQEIVGRKVREVRMFRPDLRYPFPDGFAEVIEGREILAVNRRAKFLIVDLGKGGFLGHLGMTGSYRTAPLNEEYRKHDHFALVFDDVQTIYHDPRRFGAVDLYQGDALGHPWLAKLGVEPLGNAFNGEALYEALKGRKTPMKSALLNQHVVAGLGNIYVCEALWQSRISPELPANQITPQQAEVLSHNIRDVLERAIVSGGSTLRDYRNASGGTGYFQHEFHVYDREGEVCKNGCGGNIERIVQSGRSTFYCPRCQSI